MPGPNPRHPKYGGKTCAHFKYGMDCEQFDTLYTTAKGKCEICRIPERETKLGVLHIDHDHAHPHAVRGLLCGPCNFCVDHVETIEDPAWWAKRARAYMANAWYKRPDSPPLAKLPGPRAKYGQVRSKSPLKVTADTFHIVMGGWKQGSNVSSCGRRLYLRASTLPSGAEACAACVAAIAEKPYLDYRPR